MALPKLETPTYELQLPSTGKNIKYRPFLVKEQKLLMMAQESNDEKQITNAMVELVSSCTFNKIDIEKSPVFDVEYIFLQIRSKAVGSKTRVMITCPDDEETRSEVQINLDEIDVQMKDKHTNEIQLTEKVKMIFRYPLFTDISNVKAGNEIQQMFSTINGCIHEIHFNDQIFNKTDMTEKEIDEFVEALDTENFKKITDFFDSMPKLRHIVSVTNPKTKVKSEVVLEGLQSFLD